MLLSAGPAACRGPLPDTTASSHRPTDQLDAIATRLTVFGEPRDADHDAAADLLKDEGAVESPDRTLPGRAGRPADHREPGFADLC